MIQEERFSRILNEVNMSGTVTVQELKVSLGISESTIRRDLTELDRKGRLLKVRGGAVSNENELVSQDFGVDIREAQNVAAKRLIAAYAASLITDDDFVYIDAGTTTELLCRELENCSAHFVTNGLSQAKVLAQKGMKVFVLGGEFKAKTEAIVGEETLSSLEKYNFTKGFFGANGITKERGFMTPEMKEAAVKKSAMGRSLESFVIADSSKFDRVSSVSFGSFDDAVIITDEIKKKYKGMKNIREVKA